MIFSNKIPKMKLTLMLVLFCLLYGVYSYKVETLRPSRDIAKQRRRNFNTFRSNSNFSPGDKLYNNLSERPIRRRANSIATNCEKPQISRCRSELAARWYGNPFKNLMVEQNIDSPSQNTYYNYDFDHPYDVINHNYFNNCTVNYHKRKYSRRSGKYLRYVRRRILASPNNCIKRLGKVYFNCLTENKLENQN